MRSLRQPFARTTTVFVFLALLGVGTTPAESQEDTLSSRIDGAVVDMATRTPVPQALLRLTNPEGHTVLTVETDDQGRFSFRTPGPGNFHLQVSALGYERKESGEFSIPPGHFLSVEIRLAPFPLPLDSFEVTEQRLAPGQNLGVTEQLIQGRLLDFESGEPVPQGTVSLLKVIGSGVNEVHEVKEVLSDDEGRFSLVTPLPGTFRLRGERIGYRTSDSPDLFLMLGDTILLDLQMAVEAIVLDPLMVRASARPWGDRYDLIGMQSFFHRQSRFAESGFGTFITRDSLANFDGKRNTNQILLSSVMQVRALNNGGGVVLARGCNPRYYVNDMEVVRGDPVHEPMMGSDPSTPLSSGLTNLGFLYPPEALEAVEVYVSPTIPAEFSQGYPCGVIALWTRRR